MLPVDAKLFIMSALDNPQEMPTASKTPQPAVDTAGTLHRIISELSTLDEGARQRLLETVATYFGLHLFNGGAAPRVMDNSHSRSSHSTTFKFSEENEGPTPKAFMLEKSPKTNVERVACLAYYLANYRGTPHVKTRDISAINTESAHRAFSNAASAVENATRLGYLVPSIKGSKQLSALGEQFVEALPDRDVAKELYRAPIPTP